MFFDSRVHVFISQRLIAVVIEIVGMQRPFLQPLHPSTEQPTGQSFRGGVLLDRDLGCIYDETVM
jgi:hypothetical protein